MLCLLERDRGEPRIYFTELQAELAQLARVELTVGDRGKYNTVPLERHIAKKLRRQRVRQAAIFLFRCVKLLLCFDQKCVLLKCSFV